MIQCETSARERGKAVRSRSSVARGRWGENVAAAHLERSGWTVVARNLRSGRDEVDLVARKGAVVAFVEVKSRERRSAAALESITEHKRERIARVAGEWVSRNGGRGLSYRFDAIGVYGVPHRGGAMVEHVENAWGY